MSKKKNQICKNVPIFPISTVHVVPVPNKDKSAKVFKNT